MEYLSSLHVSVRHICLCTQGNTVEYNFIFLFTAGGEKGKKKKKARIMLSPADLSESFWPLIVHDYYRVGQKVCSSF